MAGADKDNKPFLLPGALFAKDGDYIITTVLGSCIAVCLWDRVKKRGGMNHYKLPLWNGDGLPSPKFGNIAIEKLIENLVGFGCTQRNLIAKVFGGAAVIQSSSGLLNVGERNIEVARDYLAQARIPIAASDIGGTQSRKVIFNTADGSILMKKAAPQ
ncbi:MAG: chemotaxis protein CheD [Magnetococcales bacterium]|nr:chemotaxis protein CheD [Magnetococcales bacterium]MBF0420888.1 chemotaxis protein CheD [Magnetococcales bacterium]MBF0436986.1 chemotaxis protein CheD [Magnetococcales bacterium]